MRRSPPLFILKVIIVTKSTVPVGTGRKIAAKLETLRPDLEEIAIASNPEFLREGSAIGDFMAPDRIIIGTESDRAQTALSNAYAPLTRQGIPLLVTGIESAEMIKYAANSFLSTRVAFINEMADICEHVGANIEQVATGIGLDKRIGQQFLKPGPGIGGSCFPKDTRAMVYIASSVGTSAPIVDTVVRSNEEHKRRMAEKIANALPHPHSEKPVAILGLTFKAGTDDIRESPSLSIIPLLLKKNIRICAHDPEGMASARQHFGNQITYADSPYAAMQDAQAAVILTEWEEYRSLDMEQMKQVMAHPLLIDLRNLYDPATVRSQGIKYISLGTA